ncbi:hypothetical protein V865_001903 [Kwoniella europaea PYCC6329]|uniref:BRCT domain-containing protein n=1 Tax=Kwoniella europaea PYCC6329 TaxID=1423913 RepID=A0AAX4KDV0_9TREE
MSSSSKIHSLSTNPSHTPSISLYRHRTYANNCPDLKRKRYGPYPTTPIRYSSSSAETSSSSFTRPSATRLDISRTLNPAGRNGCSTYPKTSTLKSYVPGLHPTGRHQRTLDDIDSIEINNDQNRKQQQEQRKNQDQDRDYFGRLGQKGVGSDFAQTQNSFDQEGNKDPGDDSDLDCLHSDYEEERNIPDSQSHSSLTMSITTSTIYHPGRDDIHDGISSSDPDFSPEIDRNTPPTSWEITISKIEEKLSYLRARWKVDLTPSTSASWDKTSMAKNTSTPSLLVRDSHFARSSFKAGGAGQQNQVAYGEDTEMGESLHNEFNLTTPKDNDHPDDSQSDTQKMNIRRMRQHRNIEDGRTLVIRPSSYRCDSTPFSPCPTPSSFIPLFLSTPYRPRRMYTKGLPSDLINDLNYWGGHSTNSPLEADIILFHRERDDPTPSTPKNSQELQLFCQAFERGQKVLSSLWVDDSIKIGKLQDEGRYEIWLNESDIPKKRAAAIKANEKRTMQHMTMHSLFHQGNRPRGKDQKDQTMIPQQDGKSEVLDLGSELESDEEFDGIGGVRKIGEKGLVTLHQFKFRSKPGS